MKWEPKDPGTMRCVKICEKHNEHTKACRCVIQAERKFTTSNTCDVLAFARRKVTPTFDTVLAFSSALSISTKSRYATQTSIR